jgi:hypothetical protein
MTAATKAEAMALQTDGIRGYIWQPALNHLRQHAEHITAALGKEGAVT